MTTALVTLTNKLAATLDMGDGTDLIQTLKSTAFKGQVSDAQMTALMVVANQYGLNPWTKEIYAFPDRNNGIVPVVGVDGWSRIINNHPQFDGIEFEQNDESCTCTIYRKDRSRPTKVTEYMVECRRSDAGPWKSHPYRMLRHKAMIQCARLAFGYGGIYDTDEAERIVESKQINPATGDIILPAPTLDQSTLQAAQDAAEQGVTAYSDFWKNTTPAIRKAIGRDAHDGFKATAVAADKARTVETPPSGPKRKTLGEVIAMLTAAQTLDALEVSADWCGDLDDPEERKLAVDKYEELKFAMEL